MKLVWKLLRENISKPQLIGFFFANLIGMSILLLSLQFYFDINPLFSQKETLFKKDYFVLTKKLGLLSSLASAGSGFHPDEIGELKTKDFIKDVGVFTPGQFGVRAGISSRSMGIGFNTDMFFESVPVQFIDVNTRDWKFSEGRNVIPIILPRNYLDLYNFGFAESRSMPKLSQDLVKMINFDITIRGNGQMQQFKGNVVGFSDRLNTILVPEDFMTWANTRFGENTDAKPVRLIVEIKDVTHPQIASYFKNKGYEVNQGNTAASKLSMFLKIIVTIVAAIGLIICVLALVILILSIYLLLEKNMQKLINLRLIGYARKTLTKPYIYLALAINGATLLLSFIVVVVAQKQYSEVVSRIFPQYESAGYLNMVLIGLILFVVLGSVNAFIIRKKIK
ncbi:hypothetical protein M2132_000470 [Dysgonomonas sp. PH5-45]|uniref:ABC transporter permease n=1 Tax=unclassified Dysgonomonas TaxID=2630389 RepID=UPI002474A77A|nr:MULTISPECIES: ABC transporter permease [unclassified Dysgonomonas]MDH6354148.1 hypothetical protein [Dysgonomonas sp. PH5-45]MDH6387001.1 hypothetical protein [Dysgonomonas sp. PH5-37]